MKLGCLTLSLACAAFVGITSPLHAITVPVAEDTFSSSKNTIGLASGKATSLAVTSKNRAFIHFSLSSLPQGLVENDIVQARLHIFTNRVLKPGVLDVRTVTSSWSEKADNGSAAPTVDNAPTPLASLDIPVGKHFFVIDVTTAVKAWITSPTTNYGLAFLSKDAVGKFYLGSKEGSGTGHTAVLEIDLATAGVPSGVFTNAGTVDGTAIEAGTVGSTQIGTGAILSGNLGTGSVTSDKLDNNSVDSAKIVDGSVGSNDVADGAIGTTKLADGAVSEDKLLDGSVTTDKIADEAVTTPKIKDAAVTEQKIANGAVTADKIATGAITADKLAMPQVFVKATKNTAQTSISAGSVTAIEDWAEVSDSTNSFEPGDGIFTAPVAGKYRVTLNALVGPTTWLIGEKVELHSNGEVLGGMNFGIGLLSAASQYLSGSSVYVLNAQETITVAVFSSRATAIAAGNGGANRLIIERIGD